MHDTQHLFYTNVATTNPANFLHSYKYAQRDQRMNQFLKIADKYFADISLAQSDKVSISAGRFLECVGQMINYATLRKKSCHLNNTKRTE